MMKMRPSEAAGALFVAALSLSGLLVLSGCEERPYPSAAQSPAEAPPPPAALAGAPSPQAYAPPRAYAPPQAYAPPPQYDAAPQGRTYDPPAIVAMAPIPNPGDPGSDGYYTGRDHGRRAHARFYPAPARSYASVSAAAHKPPVYAASPASPAHARTSAPQPKGYAGGLTPTGPVKPYTPPKDYKPAAPPAYAAAAPSPAASPKAAPPKLSPYAKAGAATVAAVAVAAHGANEQTKPTAGAGKPAAAPPATPPAPAAAGDRASRLAALQSALTDAISKGAVLTAPQRFTANQPADVSLSVPAGFADTLRTEAQKTGLSDSAASVNLTAVLSGDGFSVTPDETQSQPLTVGQPTEFRWTVTAQPGAKGPLHADVGADLLGGGSDTLALGSVQKQAGFGVKPTPRMVGAAILVLILALVVVWLARGRGPSRPASARRAARAARDARPLDIGAAES